MASVYSVLLRRMAGWQLSMIAVSLSDTSDTGWKGSGGHTGTATTPRLMHAQKPTRNSSPGAKQRMALSPRPTRCSSSHSATLRTRASSSPYVQSFSTLPAPSNHTTARRSAKCIAVVRKTVHTLRSARPVFASWQ